MAYPIYNRHDFIRSVYPSFDELADSGLEIDFGLTYRNYVDALKSLKNIVAASEAMPSTWGVTSDWQLDIDGSMYMSTWLRDAPSIAPTVEENLVGHMLALNWPLYGPGKEFSQLELSAMNPLSGSSLYMANRMDFTEEEKQNYTSRIGKCCSFFSRFGDHYREPKILVIFSKILLAYIYASVVEKNEEAYGFFSQQIYPVFRSYATVHRREGNAMVKVFDKLCSYQKFKETLEA